MPTKKPQPNNPEIKMDPDVEARRSGPAASAAGADRPDRVHDIVPAPSQTDAVAFIAMIEEMLKDPEFDTSGRYRERLAVLTQSINTHS